MKTFDIYLKQCENFQDREAFFQIIKMMGLSEDTERITGVVIADQIN